MLIYIYNLISTPIRYNKNPSGELNIIGNTEKNIIVFSFKFDNSNDIVPVIVLVRSIMNEYRFCCDIFNEKTSTVETPFIYPDFNIREGIRIIQLEPIVSYTPLDGD
jgi:hypothetical protein